MEPTRPLSVKWARFGARLIWRVRRTLRVAELIQQVTLLWKRFSPLEERLLSEVRTVLPPAAQRTFEAQVAAITHVQRSPPSWSEISFYRLTRGVVDWTGVPLFPYTDECRLAEVRFSAAGRAFKSTLTCIGGHLFDFVTIPGPKAVAFETWEPNATARLLADPLRAPTGRREPEALPKAWLDVLGTCRAGFHGTWQLHDAQSAYRVAVADGEYLVLAESEGERYILQRVEPPAEGMFYLPHYDGVPEPVVGDVGALIREGA
jgi:hypothetical protein